MKATQFILHALLQEGLNHVFMVPGGLIDDFYSDLCVTGGVKPIVAAHEAGALFMADGYARATGHFSAGLVIGGPGVTNTVTALAAAYTDRTPLLVISGEVPTDWEGMGGFQDASLAGLNDIDILNKVTRYSMEVENIHLLSHHLHEALSKMIGISKGPVHLSIPIDIQTADVETTYRPFLKVLEDQRLVSIEKVDEIKKVLMQKVTRVAILAGAGVEESQASDLLLKIAEKHQIPIATTLRAKGVFPEDHPLSLGVFGYAGTPHAIETIISPDLEVLIILGSGVNQRDSLFWNQKIHPSKALIQVDKDPVRISSNLSVTLPIIGDCREVLKHLLQSELDLTQTVSERKKWIGTIRSQPRLYNIEDTTQEEIPLHPAFVITELRKASPRDTVLVVDSGAHRAFCGHYWEAYAPRHYLSATNLGPMGWAIPAGIGAKIARPNHPCVVVTGDGCMKMHGLEIETAARYHVPVIFVVINNCALGNVYLRAKTMGEGPCKLTEIPLHDWVGFAKALGAQGKTIDKPEQLLPAFKEALGSKGPFVLDVRCGRDFSTPVTPYSKAKKAWHDH